MKKYQSTADTELTLANHNQQYSQKNNIKFIGWKKNAKETFREDMYAILKTAGVTTQVAQNVFITLFSGCKDVIGKRFYNFFLNVCITLYFGCEDVIK